MRLYKLHDSVALRGGAMVRGLPSAEFGGGSYVTESSFELRCAEKVLILSAQDDHAQSSALQDGVRRYTLEELLPPSAVVAMQAEDGLLLHRSSAWWLPG